MALLSKKSFGFFFGKFWKNCSPFYTKIWSHCLECYRTHCLVEGKQENQHFHDNNFEKWLLQDLVGESIVRFGTI